jgi:hypothetical protein
VEDQLAAQDSVKLQRRQQRKYIATELLKQLVITAKHSTLLTATVTKLRPKLITIAIIAINKPNHFVTSRELII